MNACRDQEWNHQPPERIKGSIKGVLSWIISISLNSQNIYLCYRKPTNNGLYLLTIAVLVS